MKSGSLLAPRWSGLFRVGCILWAVLLLGSSGCQSTRPATSDGTVWARFHLESAPDVAGLPLALPQSGSRIAVNPKPVITEGDVVNVELVQVDLGKCLMFQLTTSAARDFYRLSGTHQGRRLVLVVNDVAVGARRIDGAMADGVVYIFVELPDDELPQLAARLKKSSIAYQREIARKG